MSEVLVLAVLWAFELERGVCDGEVVACVFAQLVDDAVAAGAIGLVLFLNGVAALGTMGPWVCHSWE